MALTELQRIRLARKVAEDLILTAKPIVIEYEPEGVSDEIRIYLKRIEDFFNKNFEEMYHQYMEQGEWLIIKLEDGSFELI